MDETIYTDTKVYVCYWCVTEKYNQKLVKVGKMLTEMENGTLRRKGDRTGNIVIMKKVKIMTIIYMKRVIIMPGTYI